jgi:DNA-binding GntR family transcriptional regulator
MALRSVMAVEVDRSSPVAPYVQIAGQLREMITSGELVPGSRLPSVEAIVQETGVAKLTARKALRRVRAEGYASVSVGMGTYVTPQEQWPQG